MRPPPILRHDGILGPWHTYPVRSPERAKSLGLKLWAAAKNLEATLRLIRGTASMIDDEKAWSTIGVGSRREYVEAVVASVASSDDVSADELVAAIEARLSPEAPADVAEETAAADRPRVLNLKHDEIGDAVYVGRAMPRRGLAGSAFGNPYHVGRDGTREEAIEAYRRWLLGQPALLDRLHELRGRRLACWCRPEPCHADVLAELVDADELLEELKAAGVRVEASGDRLRLSPASKLDEALVARVRPHKAGLLALLEARSRPARRGVHETPEEARLRVAAAEEWLRRDREAFVEKARKAGVYRGLAADNGGDVA